MASRKYTQLTLLDEPASVVENTVCKVCGRPLKNPLSRLKGVGPVCEKKLRKA